jgi:transcriptional regulator with XRE-family HTH domain
MTLHSKGNLLENLRDKKFRDSFVSARVDGGTAFQVRYMREKEGWTQEELARRLATSQNAVWRLESPNYGKANIGTLKRIASTFDVALIVRFVRFSELVNHVLNQTTDSVTVDSFDEDYELWEQEAPAAAHSTFQSSVVTNRSALAAAVAGQSQQERKVEDELLETLPTAGPMASAAAALSSHLQASSLGAEL